MKMRDIHRMIRKSTATIRTDAARTTITNTTSILILAIYLNLGKYFSFNYYLYISIKREICLLKFSIYKCIKLKIAN